MAVMSCCRKGSRQPSNACSTTAAAGVNTVLCQSASKANSPLRRGTSSPDRLSRTSQRYDPTHCHPGQARTACIYLNQAARRAFALDNLRHLT
jgi:hypothetical protein